MSTDDGFGRRRPVPMLSRENSEKWFPLFEQWLIGEDIHIAIIGPQIALPAASTPATTGTNTPASETSTTQAATSSQDLTFKKADAKVQYWLSICISEDDQEWVTDQPTAKAKWDTLKSKYEEKLQTTGRQYLQDFISYKMEVGVTIDEAWTHLSKLGRKVAATQKDMAGLAKPERRFQQLLQALPDGYVVIRDAIDAQDDPNIERGIRKLQEKEAQLQAETALWAGQRKAQRAKGKSYDYNHNKRSSSNERDRPPYRGQERKPSKCYLCGEDHRMRECPHLPAARKLIKSKGKKSKKDSPAPPGIDALIKLLQLKQQQQRKKHRAYNVEDDSEEDQESSDSGLDLDPEDEEISDEIAALSKDVTCKVPKSKWVADSGASSHMTDQLRLFSGPLTCIRRRTIKVGGGRLYADHCGTVIMRDKGGNSIRLSDVLYVDKLGVNLLSGKRMCEKGLRGSFDQNGLYMHDQFGKLVVKATERGGVYVVEKIANGYDSFALYSSMQRDSHAAFPAEVDTTMEDQPSAAEPNAGSKEATTDQVDHSQPAKQKAAGDYQLWHRRFAHLGPEKIRNLHKVTTLERPIVIATSDHEVCEVCALTKFRNKRAHQVSERKLAILALISIDICGQLPLSHEGHAYFLEIIDNYSRKIWTIPLKRREDAPKALREWRVKTELQSGARVMAVRSDNATELKATLDEWCASFGITPQYTVPYMSIQNGVAERAIQTTENSVRAMIKDAELPIEFWAEAAETDAYLRNRTSTGPTVDGNPTSPEEAFTGEKPSIDHIRVWGCKCYSYVDAKSLPAEGRRDKFMDRGRVGVFMGYVDETAKRYRLWAPDMGRVITSHAVKFNENEKGGTIELKLRKPATPNVLPERRPVGRPRKNPAPTSAPAALLRAPMAAAPATPNTFEDDTHDAQVDSEQATQDNMEVELPGPDLEVRTAPNTDASKPIGMMKRFLRAEVPRRHKRELPGPDLEVPAPSTPSTPEPTSSDKRPLDLNQNGSTPSLLNADTNQTVRQFSHVEIPKSRIRKLVGPNALTPEQASADTKDQDLDAKAVTIASGAHSPSTPPSIDEVPFKRQREDDYDPAKDQHIAKRLCAMLALMAGEEEVDCSQPKGVEIHTPTSYAEAVGDPVWGELWKEAINAELTALASNGTWEEVVPPKGANIVTSKWVLKPKLQTDGKLDKLKARVVARGFSQRHGIDYEDTFAPTVRFATLRTFLAIVAMENLECHQLDVNNAFTESFLKEVIYMAAPPGVKVAPGRVLRILRSLYGLKQAARDWNERCTVDLVKLGFVQSLADPCLFTHAEKGVTVLLYVDDIPFAARTIEGINWFKNTFAKVFKIKDLGEIKKILNIQVTRDRQKRTLRLDQSHYLSDMFTKLGIQADKHKPTEIPLNGYDALRPAGPDDQRIDPREYQHIVGKLMYAMIHTRPDIAFALSRLSQFLADPAEHHGQALKGLLRYVRSTINLGITYGSSGSQGLVAYSDSDYAMDKQTRRSILGYIYMLGGGPISWISRKQKSVATSTSEAEYMAMSTCAKEALWITQILIDMKFNGYLGSNPYRVNIREDERHRKNSPVLLRGDNQSALTLAKDAHIQERSKHIDVAYHHIRDLHRKNQIKVEFVPSQEMIADGLTKPLQKQNFKRFLSQLGLTSSGSS